MLNSMVLTFIFFFIISCGREDERCARQVVCTDIFKMVTVEVQTDRGESSSLDSAVVKNMTTGSSEVAELISHPNDYAYYIVADDADRDNISFDGTTFQFKGWLGSALVVEEEFLIGKDCCHIEKLAGQEKVIVN